MMGGMSGMGGHKICSGSMMGGMMMGGTPSPDGIEWEDTDMATMIRWQTKT